MLPSGGLDDGQGFVVPFAEIPLSFAFDGEGAQITARADLWRWMVVNRLSHNAVWWCGR